MTCVYTLDFVIKLPKIVLKLQKVDTKICHLLQSGICHNLNNVLINDCLCHFVYCTNPHFHLSFFIWETVLKI